MDLNERKLRILKSIIDEYIDKGEPVGSKHLVEYGNISLSPATIRNEMSELEEMGYLDKPHTSAGRIPSNAAYRIYVEQLMENYRLNVEELELLKQLTRFKTDETNKLLERAGKVFSEITHCVSLSFVSPSQFNCVKRFDAMLIDSRSFLLAIILPDGSVNSEHIRTDIDISLADVETVKKALNDHLCDVPLDSVSLPVMLILEQEFGLLGYLVNNIVRKIYSSVCPNTSGDVKIEGISNLLSYPEFTDINKVRGLINLVEENHAAFRDVMNIKELDEPSINQNGLQVYIGDENKLDGLSDTSVVFCKLPVGAGRDAVIGILGPKRMDYRKVISALRVFAENLESLPESKQKDNDIQ